MKRTALIMALALGASVFALIAQDQTGASSTKQRPADTEKGQGGPRGPAVKPGFHVLPPWAVEQLNLTDDQKKQL